MPTLFDTVTDGLIEVQDTNVIKAARLAMAASFSQGSISVSKYLPAPYGAFNLVGAAIYAFGAGLAVERRMGWLEAKRASPMPAGAYLPAKLSVPVVVGAMVVSLLFAPAARAIRFGAIGLAIGSFAGPSSAPGTVNMIYLPLAYLGGWWIPIDAMPRMLQQFAPLLPSYHFRANRAGDSGRAGARADRRARGGADGFGLRFAGIAWISPSREHVKMYG